MIGDGSRIRRGARASQSHIAATRIPVITVISVRMGREKSNCRGSAHCRRDADFAGLWKVLLDMAPNVPSNMKPYEPADLACARDERDIDRKSTRVNSSHLVISYAVFCLKKKDDQRGARPHLPPPHRLQRVRSAQQPRVADHAELQLGAGPIFFFNDTATTEIYTLSLHDALPI